MIFMDIKALSSRQTFAEASLPIPSLSQEGV